MINALWTTFFATPTNINIVNCPKSSQVVDLQEYSTKSEGVQQFHRIAKHNHSNMIRNRNKKNLQKSSCQILVQHETDLEITLRCKLWDLGKLPNLNQIIGRLDDFWSRCSLGWVGCTSLPTTSHPVFDMEQEAAVTNRAANNGW